LVLGRLRFLHASAGVDNLGSRGLRRGASPPAIACSLPIAFGQPTRCQNLWRDPGR